MSNTQEKAPIKWHFNCQLPIFMKTLKSGILEAYKVQVDCLKLFEKSDSDSDDKNDTKKKVNNLVRLYKAMQEKLTTG